TLSASALTCVVEVALQMTKYSVREVKCSTCSTSISLPLRSKSASQIYFTVSCAFIYALLFLFFMLLGPQILGHRQRVQTRGLRVRAPVQALPLREHLRCRCLLGRRCPARRHPRPA